MFGHHGGRHLEKQAQELTEPSVRYLTHLLPGLQRCNALKTSEQRAAQGDVNPDGRILSHAASANGEGGDGKTANKQHRKGCNTC